MKKLTIFSLLLSPLLANAEPIFEGLRGEDLADRVRQEFYPETVHGYTQSRRHMFETIDNKDGKVRLVYTGKEFATNSIPNHNEVNTEHTWPQSLFN